MASKTSTGQRIAIWVILGFTVLSTVALYAGVVVGQNNANKEAREQQKQMERYQELVNEYQAKVDKRADELSAKYYDLFKDYEKSPKSFNAANVKELKVKDLKIGDGAEITEDSTDFYAYYIGWKPDGEVFDSSFDEGKLKIPLAAKKTGDSWGVIDGWSEGVMGMRIGGIRELTIPADKAYGESGFPNEEDKSKNIDPNTPLKFVIMLIPKFEQIPQPDFSELGL